MKAIAKYIKKVSPVLGVIDFHSFSQLVLYPYSELTQHTSETMSTQLMTASAYVLVQCETVMVHSN